MSEGQETTTMMTAAVGAPKLDTSPVARKRSAAQLALDQATEDCTGFAKLAERLERVRVAFEGRGLQEGGASAPGKADTKPTSHLEGLAYIHDCNIEVRRRMEQVVSRLEDALDCRIPPVAT